jgi:hypothetical protein
MNFIRAVCVLSSCLFGAALAFGGGGGSAPRCTIEIAQADEVYSPGSENLRFSAQVSGSGCYGTAVRWSAVRSDGAWYTTPYTVYDPSLPREYSRVEVSGASLGLFPLQSDGYYSTVTASVGSASASVTVIGDGQAIGTSARSAITLFQNSEGKMETKPFWYFAKKINDGTCCSDIAFYYRGFVNEYWTPTPTDWFAQGFNAIEDRIVFDPYAAVNIRQGYTAIRRPGGGPIYGAAKVNGSRPQIQLRPTSEPCEDGNCVSLGGVFMGFQGGLQAPWAYFPASVGLDGYHPWQHAAIRTDIGLYTEAPRMGRTVRQAPIAEVRAPYYRRVAYLEVNDSRGTQVAAWALKQRGKPYSLLPMGQWNQPGNTNASYPGFYCSLLVWGAWYHGAGVNIASSDVDKFGFVFPAHLYQGHNEGKSRVVLEFTRN